MSRPARFKTEREDTINYNSFTYLVMSKTDLLLDSVKDIFA